MLGFNNAKGPFRSFMVIFQVKNLVTEIQQQTSLHWNYRSLRSLPKELLEEGSHVQYIYLKCNLLTYLVSYRTLS